MKKVNAQQICEQYNKARSQNADRKGSIKWTLDILKSFGIGTNMAKRMMRESVLFTPCKRENAGRGNNKGLIFPCIPVHISWFENWLSEKKTPKVSVKDENFETTCATYLKQQGYKLKKLIGFDEDAFKKAYPQLWEKFLVYEEV